MKAAIFHGPKQPLTIEEVEIDSPLDREVLVKTVASGVCHSDLHFVDGLYPHPAPAILGHEAAGIVEQVGSGVSYLKPGDHVIACLSVFCGYCEDCMSGHPALCSNKGAIRRSKSDKPRITKNGAPVRQFAELSTYAEKMLVHENALVKINKDIPLDRAALVGCGVTTGMGAVLNTAHIEPGSTVAVFGCGGVGLAAIQGARIAGARMIIAVDQFESKLALAKRVGATHTVDSSKDDPVKTIRELTNPDAGQGSGGSRDILSPPNSGVDYAFEAVGLKVLAEMCFEAIKPGGTATVIGMIPVGQKVSINGAKLLTERRLQGSNMGSNRFRIDMPRYLDYYQQGRLNLDDLISRRGKLEDVNEAFRAMKAGEVARTVLMFE
ncbi:MAG TPA: Zn-dependent alcohol dehydrogenase [Candidatus Binataceae bacterium]|nr:Zn-dependent alcohol dehydrogenase [Candidatus Binataceae bacterium]